MPRLPQDRKIFLAVFLAVLLLTGVMFLPFLSALVLALVLAVVFHPLYRAIHRRMEGWEGTAAFLTMLTAFVVVLVPLSFFGFELAAEARAAYGRFAAGGFDFVWPAFFSGSALPPDFLRQSLQGALGWIVGNAQFLFSSFARGVVMIALSIFALFYFLKDGPRWVRAILDIAPLGEKDGLRIAEELRVAVESVALGAVVVAFIQGFIVGLGFWIFGIPDPVFWGSVSVVAAFIPIISVSIVVVPAAVLLALSGNAAAGIEIAVWSLVLVGLTDNLLRPLLMKRHTGIHPLFMFLGVVGGLWLFGPVGIIAGPLVVSLLRALAEVYKSAPARAR